MKKIKLAEIAYCRAGDKRDISNVAVHPYRKDDYELLLKELTEDMVSKAYAGLVKGKVERYEFPGIKSLNFVMYEALDGGVERSLCLDLHGKNRPSIMFEVEIEVPDDYEPLPKPISNL